MNIAGLIERRSLLKAGAALGGFSAMSAPAVVAQRSDVGIEVLSDQVQMADIPISSTTKVTIERRGQIILIGINRPYIQNRIDPRRRYHITACPRRSSSPILQNLIFGTHRRKAPRHFILRSSTYRPRSSGGTKRNRPQLEQLHTRNRNLSATYDRKCLDK
jgi:hypothetical protein